jgi:excisionase family DNA binding protein
MLLRSTELAEKLGVTKQTVLAMTRKNLIPFYRLPSGHNRYDYDEIITHLRDAEGGTAIGEVRDDER